MVCGCKFSKSSLSDILPPAGQYFLNLPNDPINLEGLTSQTSRLCLLSVTAFCYMNQFMVNKNSVCKLLGALTPLLQKWVLTRKSPPWVIIVCLKINFNYNFVLFMCVSVGVWMGILFPENFRPLDLVAAITRSCQKSELDPGNKDFITAQL